jgi:hypothetical protein
LELVWDLSLVILSLSIAVAEAVTSLIVDLLLPQVLSLCCDLPSVVDQFDNGHFGIVTDTAAELDDACVAAVAVLVTRTEFAEEPLNGFDACSSFDRVASPFLPRKRLCSVLNVLLPAWKYPAA